MARIDAVFAAENQRGIPRWLMIAVVLLVAARAFAAEPLAARLDSKTRVVAEGREVRLVRGRRVIWRGWSFDRIEAIKTRDLVGDARPEVIIDYDTHARNPASGV